MSHQPGAHGSPGSRNTGSQRALRELNTASVIDALAQHGSQSQAEIARLTGLSAGTVSNIVRDLIANGRVTSAPAVSQGRRTTQVTLAADPRIVVGLDIGRTHLSLLFSDISRRTFGFERVKLTTGHSPADTFTLASALIDTVLEREGITRDRVVQCGIALAASVEPIEGYIVQASALPVWANTPLRELSSSILGIPTSLANDADLGALAHATFGDYKNLRNLVYVKVATGIGMGLSADAKLYRSTSGLSGEIGHFQITDAGDVCYCGRRGCLETVASVRRILSDLSYIRSGEPVTIDDLIAEAQSDNAAIYHLLEQAGTALGRALYVICNVFAPDLIIIGGPLTSVGQPIADACARSIRQTALSAAAASTRIVLSNLDERDEVLGACGLALQELNDWLRRAAHRRTTTADAASLSCDSRAPSHRPASPGHSAPRKSHRAAQEVTTPLGVQRAIPRHRRATPHRSAGTPVIPAHHLALPHRARITAPSSAGAIRTQTVRRQ